MLLLVPGEGLIRGEFGAALVAVVGDLVRRPRVTVQRLLVRALHVALGALQGRYPIQMEVVRGCLNTTWVLFTQHLSIFLGPQLGTESLEWFYLKVLRRVFRLGVEQLLAVGREGLAAFVASEVERKFLAVFLLACDRTLLFSD